VESYSLVFSSSSQCPPLIHVSTANTASQANSCWPRLSMGDRDGDQSSDVCRLIGLLPDSREGGYQTTLSLERGYHVSRWAMRRIKEWVRVSQQIPLGEDNKVIS
jgi:hypothetical protein